MPENIREIFTRICNKHDLEVNWQNRANFKPLHGELIIYDKEVDANGNTLELPSDRVTPYTHERLKLGDGVTLINDLPFIDIKGKDGTSGVYVGSGDMPEGYNVQIDPDGDIEVDLLAKIDEVLVEAKTYVDEEIENLNVVTKVDEALAEAKAYTDKELAEFDFIKVVDTLPNPGLPNRIYLVPKTSEDQANSPGLNAYDLFDEYIWKSTSRNDGAWEWITTKQFEIDLTEYVKLSKVEELILARSKKDHPVNSIYITTTNTNPNSILGFGTWSLIAKDRMLIGAGNKYSAGATGGAETVTLTAKQVPKVEGQIGIHGGATATNIHTVQGCFTAGITNTNKYINYGSGTTGADSIGQIRFSNGGTGAAHNNMPPYYAVYFWKRTA